MSKKTYLVVKNIKGWDWERCEPVAVCNDKDEAKDIWNWLERNTREDHEDYRISYSFWVVDEVNSLKDFKYTYEDDDLVEV